MAILPRSAGIYRIDGPNGCVYIGSTVNLQKRLRGHRNLLNKGTHDARHLQNAWNKYGAGEFTFSVVELVDDIHDLLRIEQIWIDILFTSLDPHSIYNTRRIAESNLGVKHSEEIRRRVSERLKGNKFALGMKHSEETRRKIALAGKGRIGATRGRKLTEQHKRKCSEGLKLAASRQTSEQKELRAARFSQNWEKKTDAEKAAHAEKSRQKGLGRKHSEESRRRMSDWHKQKSLSASHRDAIARSQRNGEIWTMISPDGQIFEDIGNVMEFAKTHSMEHKAVRRALHTGKNKAGWRGIVTRKDSS